MPVGNEGAGVVIRTGSSDAAKALMGRTVAMIGGAMYAQYRTLRVTECLPLPEGTTPAEGASCFVNPLTALGMTETMRREGHKALVHTAAASNLGQMLNRICLKDGIGLVNIVRNKEQADILHKIGAKHVVDSSAPISWTSLPVRWSRPARPSPSTRSAAASSPARSWSRWRPRSTKPPRPTAATARTRTSRSISMAASTPARSSCRAASAWPGASAAGCLFPFLMKIGPEAGNKLRQRVVAELKTTFASHYTKVVSLQETLQLEQHRRLRQARHRREIPDQPEQGRRNRRFAGKRALFTLDTLIFLSSRLSPGDLFD